MRLRFNWLVIEGGGHMKQSRAGVLNIVIQCNPLTSIFCEHYRNPYGRRDSSPTLEQLFLHEEPTIRNRTSGTQTLFRERDRTPTSNIHANQGNVYVDRSVLCLGRACCSCAAPGPLLGRSRAAPAPLLTQRFLRRVCRCVGKQKTRGMGGGLRNPPAFGWTDGRTDGRTEN